MTAKRNPINKKTIQKIAGIKKISNKNATTLFFKTRILRRFKEEYELFPSGEIVQTDRPDFIITSKVKIIGIEVAEIFQDSHLGKSSKLKEREILQNEFGIELLQLLISKQMRKQFFMLDIVFANNQSVSKKQIKDLVQQCWIPCMEFLWNNSKGSIRIKNDGSDLPDIIDSLFIQLANYNEEPIYCNQGGIKIAINNPELLHFQNFLIIKNLPSHHG